MKSGREWLLDALGAAGMALELEQRPAVLQPLHQAVQLLEIALAQKDELPQARQEPHRRE